jgi:trk system potassium uptake protein TrkA
VYIVVVGAGDAGLHIASLLSKEEQEITVIERSEEVVEDVRRQMDVGVVQGNAVAPRILREAEVERADLVVATTGVDEANMVICFISKQMGAKKTVARVRNPEYSGYFVVAGKTPYGTRRVVRPRSLGIDLFCNPEIEAADNIIRSLSGLYVTPTEEFAGGRVQLRGFRAEEAGVVGKDLCGIHFPKPCVPALVLRGDEVMIPSRDEVVRRGDHVYVFASRKDMDRIGAVFNQPGMPTRNVVVFGGGTVGFHVARELERRGMEIKLIEKSASRSQEVSTQLKRTVVVQGGRPDRDLLADEGVASADAFIASTGDEALNIVAGLVAKRLGVARVIVLVDRPEYIALAETVGLDVAISPVLLAGSKITHFILHGGAVSVALLGNEQAEAIEYVVSSEAAVTKTGDDGVRVPKGAIIGAIVRGDEVILPPGNTSVHARDRVIIVSLLASIPDVEELFK